MSLFFSFFVCQLAKWVSARFIILITITVIIYQSGYRIFTSNLDKIDTLLFSPPSIACFFPGL